ncbi:MAG: hypothetical protein GY856_38960 [bacterium]|nr:hypothetical protein [bacterium]
MSGNREETSTKPRSALRTELRAELDAGIVMAADPDNANLPELARRVTTIHSRWYTRTCRECKLKFREGDQVRLCPECGEPYHDDPQYELHCWQRHFQGGRRCTEGGTDRFDEREIRACNYAGTGDLPDDRTRPGVDAQPAGPTATLVSHFVHGLERFWRPFGEQQAVRVGPGSPLVGRDCPWCRFRVRAGDWVVACPCGCGSYFHQDVFRHMTCWNEWNGVEGNDYCPNTGRSYSQPGSDDHGAE